MKKQNRKNVTIGGIIVILVAFVFYLLLFGTGLVAIQRYANPNEKINARAEMIVLLNSGDTVGSLTAEQHIRQNAKKYVWEWQLSSNRISGGSSDLSSLDVDCLVQKIYTTSTKTCIKDIEVLTPSSPGVYQYYAYVGDSVSNKITGVREYDFLPQVTIVASGNCKASYYKSETTSITNGQILKQTYYVVSNNYPTCTETVDKSDYFITCNQNYVQEGSGSSSKCVLKTITLPIEPIVECTDNQAGKCIDNNLEYRKCVDSKYKDTTLTCSNTQTCDEKTQNCIEKEIVNGCIAIKLLQCKATEELKILTDDSGCDYSKCVTKTIKCTKFQTLKDNKCSFSADKFFSDKVVITSFVTGFVLLIVIIFFVFMPKKRRK